MLKKLLLFALSVVLLGAGCGAKYAHFEPESESLYRLEFDYPVAWADENLSTSTLRADGIESLYIADPSNSTRVPNERSSIVVVVIMGTVEDMDSAISEFRQVHEAVWFTTSADQEITIDGYSAHRFTTLIKAERFHQEVASIEEVIFCYVNDRYYRITLTVPEYEQNGEFVQEFWRMVESIQVIEP